MGEEQAVVLGDFLRSPDIPKEKYLRFKELAKKGNTNKGRIKLSVPYGRTKR